MALARGLCKPGPPKALSCMKYLGIRGCQAWDPASKDGKYSNDTDQGDTSPGGRGGYFLRLLARLAAGPLGPWGDPDVVSFQLTVSQNGRGGHWGGHKEEPRGPQGLLRSRQGGGAICSPGCRLQGSRMGHKEGLTSTTLQGHLPGLTPPEASSRGPCGGLSG